MATMGRTKSIPREMTKRVGSILRELVERQFRGNQSEAAKWLGISQAIISDLTRLEPTKGVGLPVLLIIRARTNRSLDDLLGLGPLPSDEIQTALQKSIEAYAAEMARRKVPTQVLNEGVSEDAPKYTGKRRAKKWTELQKQGLAVRGTRALKRKAHEPSKPTKPADGKVA